jgi:hypothetical protein
MVNINKNSRMTTFKPLSKNGTINNKKEFKHKLGKLKERRGNEKGKEKVNL